jgi:alcohol dehydrogenase
MESNMRIFPTGYAAVDWCDLKGGETVAVFGCGPVGLMAQKAAWLRGAGRVIGIDIEPYRLEMARATTSAEVIDATSKDPVEVLRYMTHGRGADAVIDAVGMEAHRSVLHKITNVVRAQVGSISAFETCLSAVRRGGVLSVVGVYGVNYDNFPWGQMFDKGVTLRMGQTPVQKYIDELMALVQSGKVRLDDIISHRIPLVEAAQGYDLFNGKKDRCVKVVLRP